jgi:hypothetical protein
MTVSTEPFLCTQNATEPADRIIRKKFGHDQPASIFANLPPLSLYIHMNYEPCTHDIVRLNQRRWRSAALAVREEVAPPTLLPASPPPTNPTDPTPQQSAQIVKLEADRKRMILHAFRHQSVRTSMPVDLLLEAWSGIDELALKPIVDKLNCMF